MAEPRNERKNEDARFFAAIAQGKLCGAYYLYGAEAYARARAVEQAEALLDPGMREMNRIKLTSAASAADVINACETLPFFDRLRLVLLTDPSAETEAALADYAARVPDTALLLIVQRSKPNAKGALFAAMKKAGRTVEFEPYDASMCIRFLHKRAAQSGYNADLPALRQLVDMVGTDLAALESALDKAGAYASGARITLQTLDACITPALSYTVFQMLDRFTAGDLGAGLAMLQTQLKNGESALGLASFFLGRVKLMLTARQWLEQGASERETVAGLGGSPYAAKMALRAARGCTTPQLEGAVRAFASVDALQKQGVMRDTDALLLAIYNSFPDKRKER